MGWDGTWGNLCVNNCVTSVPVGSINVWEQPHFGHFCMLSLWLCNLNSSVFCPHFCVHCFVRQKKNPTAICYIMLLSMHHWNVFPGLPGWSLFPPVPLPSSPLSCICAVQFSCCLNSSESLKAEQQRLTACWLGGGDAACWMLELCWKRKLSYLAGLSAVSLYWVFSLILEREL